MKHKFEFHPALLDGRAMNTLMNEQANSRRVYNNKPENITHEELKRLEDIFWEHAQNKNNLDMAQFCEATRQATGRNYSDEQLGLIFKKIDCNSIGTVTWDDYISYMVLECQKKDVMDLIKHAPPLPKRMRLVPKMRNYYKMQDSVIKIHLFPSVSKHKSNLYDSYIDANVGRYISMSDNGTLNIWDMKLNHWKKHQLPAARVMQKDMDLWVTDFVPLTNLNMIAVATTAGTITFYSLTALSFDVVLVLHDLDICVTCMDYHIDPECLYKAKLIWGDVRGNINILEFDECPTMCFLQPKLNINFKERVRFSDLISEPPCGVKAHKIEAVHNDIVLEVRYFPKLNGRRSILSCCRQKTTALRSGYISKQSSHYFPVRNGVATFDYSPKQNLIFSGGKDGLIRIWNPLVKTPILVLTEPKAPIKFLHIHDENDVLFSVALDKEIYVFDVNKMSYIQRINSKWVKIGPKKITSAAFNPYRKALVIGNNNLAIFERKKRTVTGFESHDAGISHVLYNELFDQIVSAGTDSMVKVWSAKKGNLIMGFYTHVIPQISGGELELAITAMIFDPSQRRLITTAGDHMIKFWNHNNGGLLKTITAVSQSVIVGLLFVKHWLITAGWDKRLTMYHDMKEEDPPRVFPQRHSDDILCLAGISKNSVVTGSYDGDILIWSLDYGDLLLHLNAHVSKKSMYRMESMHSFGTDEVPNEQCSGGDYKKLRGFLVYNTARPSIAEKLPPIRPAPAGSDRTDVVTDAMQGRRRSCVESGREKTHDAVQGRRKSCVDTGLDRRQDSDMQQHIQEIFMKSNTALDCTEIEYEKNYNSNNMHCDGRSEVSSSLSNSSIATIFYDVRVQTDVNNMDDNVNNNNPSRVADMLLVPAEDLAKPSNINNQLLVSFQNIKQRITKAEENRLKQRYDAYLRKNESAVTQVVHLENRVTSCDTATLMAVSSYGWIRFWAIERMGGLLGQFNGAHNVGGSITAVHVDERNQLLLTGDSQGYIKLWNIQDYCIGPFKSKKLFRYRKIMCEKFPSLALRQKLEDQSKFRPPPSTSSPEQTWRAPKLLNSFRGHLQLIHDIAYMESTEAFISASDDCSIRLFTIYGEFIGVYDHDLPWRTLETVVVEEIEDESFATHHYKKAKKRISGLSAFIGDKDVSGRKVQLPPLLLAKRRVSIKPEVEHAVHKEDSDEDDDDEERYAYSYCVFPDKALLPKDILSCGSATTLQVMRAGKMSRRWRLVKYLVRYWMPAYAEITHMTFSEMELYKQELRKKKGLRPLQINEPLDLSGVNRRLQILKTTPTISKVLGTDYRPMLMYKPLPKLDHKPVLFGDKLSVYTSLKCLELEPVKDKLTPPDFIQKLQKKKLSKQAFERRMKLARNINLRAFPTIANTSVLVGRKIRYDRKLTHLRIDEAEVAGPVEQPKKLLPKLPNI